MKITAAFDPVTRIEGHLNIEITVDTVNGVQQVVDVRSIGGLFRGFEKVLIGRDPRDAQHITERICGVCPVAHGMAAVKTLDDAYGTAIPKNALIMRNLVNGGNFVESHILHFYLLAAPDFLEGPAMPPWQADWKQDRRLSKAETDMLMGHYLQALTMRRKADQLTALFGGKMPHPPAYIAGGFTCTPRPERIAEFNSLIDELTAFIRNVYLPDVVYMASKYSDYFSIGRGCGNLLSYGVFDTDHVDGTKLLSRGYSAAGSRTVEPLDAGEISEHVKFSWFADAEATHPGAGQSVPVDPASKEHAYSWLKAPRYKGKPAEVGPLARMWVTGDYQNGISLMDRHAARAHEALKVALALKTWVNELVPDGAVYVTPTQKASVSGNGLTEAPRGALGHWLDVGADGKIARYQVISPTTWNACPRDGNGVHGPLEEAILGTPIGNIDEPIEIMRIIHSFDPCLDCATHVMRPGKNANVYRLGR